MKRIRDLIFRDVKNENEPSRPAYILRLCCLTMFPYFLPVVIFWFYSCVPAAAVCGIFCGAGYVLAIFLSYHEKTRKGYLVYYLFSGIWIVVSVLAGGWGQGAAYLWFVLLLLIFASAYHPVRVQIFESAFLFAAGYLLYYVDYSHTAWLRLTEGKRLFLEGINTAVAFADMVAIMLIFASATTKAERKLENYNERLKQLAGLDALTQLPNRRSMISYIRRDVLQRKTAAVCLAMGDIDFFKKINDTYGHGAGDKVLEELSHAMKEFMKDKGIVARWGGEEFLFYFHQNNLDIVGCDMRDFLDQVREMEICYSAVRIRVTMTFGVVDTVLEGDSGKDIRSQLDRAIEEADQILYQGKANGRNQVVF